MGGPQGNGKGTRAKREPYRHQHTSLTNYTFDRVTPAPSGAGQFFLDGWCGTIRAGIACNESVKFKVSNEMHNPNTPLGLLGRKKQWHKIPLKNDEKQGIRGFFPRDQLAATFPPIRSSGSSGHTWVRVPCVRLPCPFLVPLLPCTLGPLHVLRGVPFGPHSEAHPPAR